MTPNALKLNPTDIVIPSDRDVIQRSLLFRNTSGKDFVLKLIPSHPTAILFPTTLFRFPPHSYRTIQFRVDNRKLGAWDRSLVIRGYVLPIYSKNLSQWIQRKDKDECQTQQAFSLNITFGSTFSAPITVVNLPGLASCIESVDHLVDVEELDTLTAVNIESDVVTAEPIGSMMNVIESEKRRKAQKSCWITGYLCGEALPEDDGKSGRSQKSQKSQRAKSRSCRKQARKTPNFCLEAAPCAGQS